jgi:hypothetical protein
MYTLQLPAPKSRPNWPHLVYRAQWPQGSSLSGPNARIRHILPGHIKINEYGLHPWYHLNAHMSREYVDLNDLPPLTCLESTKPQVSLVQGTVNLQPHTKSFFNKTFKLGYTTKTI